MSPRPLNQFRNFGAISFWADSLEDRPEFAARIMRIIGIWSMIDVDLAEIFCRLSHGDLRIGAFALSVVDNFRHRRAMIEQAATVALQDDPELFNLLVRILDIVEARSKVRNELAHAIWGIPDREGMIVRCDPRYWARDSASRAELDRLSKLAKTQEDLMSIDNSKYYVKPGSKYPFMVYTMEELDREIRSSIEDYSLVSELDVVLDPTRSDSDRAIFRKQLKAQLQSRGKSLSSSRKRPD